MLNISNLLFHSILWGSLISLFFNKKEWPKWSTCLIALVILSIFLLTEKPLQTSLSIFHYLSIPLIVILMDYLSPKSFFSEKEKNQFFLLFFLCGLIFYPLAFSLNHINSYSWGWDNSITLFSIFIVLTIALSLNNKLILISVTLALFTNTILFYPTTNLWSYLIDPILFFCSTFKTFKYFFKKT